MCAFYESRVFFRNFEIQMKISIFWGHFFWFTQRPQKKTISIDSFFFHLENQKNFIFKNVTTTQRDEYFGEERVEEVLKREKKKKKKTTRRRKAQ